MFWACGLRPGHARRVAVDAANLPDFATAEELESHTNVATDSRSAARFNSRHHQRAHPSDNVFRSLRGAGATGTISHQMWGTYVCQPNLLPMLLLSGYVFVCRTLAAYSLASSCTFPRTLRFLWTSPRVNSAVITAPLFSFPAFFLPPALVRPNTLPV